MVQDDGMADELAATSAELLQATPQRVRGQLLLQQLRTFYEEFRADRLEQLDSLYTADVEFRDPVHTLTGSLAFKHYLRKMGTNLQHYHIRYLDEASSSNSAYLSWEMDYSHPQLNGGQLIMVRGITHLKFTDKVYYHEDCYDMGALVYEHVPLLGFATRKLKQRLAR
jgi:hypothetical protein